MEKRRTSDKGNLSELKVITSYIEAGFAVSIPFGGVPYDLIVDTRAALLKIQVKTRRLRNGWILFPTMRFSGHSGKGHRYNPGEIDLFAIYCPDNEQVYIMSHHQSLTEGRIRCSDTELPKTENSLGKCI
jgi:PD-(D/E)XK endonuclease